MNKSKLWKQPILTENGTLGGSSFAVWSDVVLLNTSSDIFNAFNGILYGGYTFHSASGKSIGSVIMYNPEPIMVKKITIYPQDNSNKDNRSAKNITIYGSNDNITYDTLDNYNITTISAIPYYLDLSSNENYYKYYKLTNNIATSAGYWVVTEFVLTAYVE